MGTRHNGTVNPSTAHARAAVSALVGSGVRAVVLAPGSRSAPLAYALVDAESAGLLELHVRLDERDAAFTALGLSRAALVAGRSDPAVVVMTSGTAVANAHPAVLEASYSRTPFLVVSADRPAELRGTGSNQTMRAQHDLFGGEVRAADDLPADAEDWDSRIRAGVRSSLDEAGPVHLNLAFRDPLVPERGAEHWRPAVPDASAAGGALGEDIDAGALLPDAPGTVLLAADTLGVDAPVLRALATERGWPVLAESVSPLRRHPNAIPGYRRLLDAAGGPAAEIRRVLTLGRPTLSRSAARLLARADVEHVVITPNPEWFGSAVPGARFLPQLWPGRDAPASAPSGNEDPPPRDGDWLSRWRTADASTSNDVPATDATAARDAPPLDRRTVADVLAAAPGLLFVGSSQVVRDLDEARTVNATVLASRGLAGIDGLIATAGGFALGARTPVRLALGDVSAVHDAGGLLTPTLEYRPPLEVVVLDDGGGGIFAGLEHGGPRFAAVFDRLFATAHGTDFEALARAFGWRYEPVASRGELDSAFEEGIVPGRLVHVRLPVLAERHQRG